MLLLVSILANLYDEKWPPIYSALMMAARIITTFGRSRHFTASRYHLPFADDRNIEARTPIIDIVDDDFIIFLKFRLKNRMLVVSPHTFSIG